MRLALERLGWIARSCGFLLSKSRDSPKGYNCKKQDGSELKSFSREVSLHGDGSRFPIQFVISETAF